VGNEFLGRWPEQFGVSVTTSIGCPASGSAASTEPAGGLWFSVGSLNAFNRVGGVIRFVVSQAGVVPSGGNLPTVGIPDFSTMAAYSPASDNGPTLPKAFHGGYDHVR